MRPQDLGIGRLFESVWDAAIVTQENTGRIVLWNPAAAKIFGYPPSEAVGMPIEALFPTHLEAHHRGGLARHRDAGNGTHTGSDVVLDLPAVRKTGEEIRIEMTSSTIEPVNGSVLERHFVLVIARDVTERKLSEERFRLLAENAQDVIYRYRFKPTPGYEYVSPSATALTGYTPEEHYADPELGLKLVHPDDKHILEAFLRSPESADRVLTLRWINKDGRVLWTEQQITPLYDAQGELAAIEGIGRNITERKEVEAALRQSEERFRSLVHNASDIIVILEADGTIRHVSPAIERVLGLQPEDVVGKNAVAFVDPLDRNEAIRIFAEAKKEPGIRPPVEFRLRHENGNWRHLEINRSNLLDDPAVGGIVFNLRDVTERKVAEEQLRRRAFHDLLG